MKLNQKEKKMNFNRKLLIPLSILIIILFGVSICNLIFILQQKILIDNLKSLLFYLLFFNNFYFVFSSSKQINFHMFMFNQQRSVKYVFFIQPREGNYNKRTKPITLFQDILLTPPDKCIVN